MSLIFLNHKVQSFTKQTNTHPSTYTMLQTRTLHTNTHESSCLHNLWNTVLLGSLRSHFNSSVQHLRRGKSGPIVVRWEDAHASLWLIFAYCTQKWPFYNPRRILLEPHSSITFHHLRNKMSTIGHHGGRVTTKGVLAWTRRANQRQNQRMSHRTKRHQDHERGREEREKEWEKENIFIAVSLNPASPTGNASRDVTNRSRRGRENQSHTPKIIVEIGI